MISLSGESQQNENHHVFVPCQIEYEGAESDIPDYLRQSRLSSCSAIYRIKTEEYTESSFFDYINPLHPLGYSVAEKGYNIVGELEIGLGGVKDYKMASSCKIAKGGSWFDNGQNDLLLIKKCHQKLKENLNIQILNWKKNHSLINKP